MIRIPTHRKPTHPGEMLREEFLGPMHISQRDLATAIHVPYQRVNELVNQKRGITPSTPTFGSICKFGGICTGHRQVKERNSKPLKIIITCGKWPDPNTLVEGSESQTHHTSR